MLASILLKEEEELTPELLERAVRALRRIHLRQQIWRESSENCSRTKGQDQSSETNCFGSSNASSGP